MMKKEDPEAERDGGAVQAGKAGLQRGDARREEDGQGQRVVQTREASGTRLVWDRSWPGRAWPPPMRGRRRSPGGTKQPHIANRPNDAIVMGADHDAAPLRRRGPHQMIAGPGRPRTSGVQHRADNPWNPE